MGITNRCGLYYVYVYVFPVPALLPLIFSRVSGGALEANAKKEVGVQVVQCGEEEAGELTARVKVERRGSRCSAGTDPGSSLAGGCRGEYSLSLKTEACPDGRNSRRLSVHSIPHS